jgi:hypothetical protein
MLNVENPQLRLQQQLDCQLEVTPLTELKAWENEGWKETPGTDVDEAPLKYMALVLLEALEDRAPRVFMDKDEGVMIDGENRRTVPKAPSFIIARGLELLREMSGMRGPGGQSTLALGLRNESLELTIQKDGGRHIINLPDFAPQV